jgi:hypothetical protein
MGTKKTTKNSSCNNFSNCREKRRQNGGNSQPANQLPTNLGGAQRDGALLKKNKK